MRLKNSNDGFGYDLDEALKRGNIFERVFHWWRILPWVSKIDYSGKKVLDIGCNTGILLIPLLEKGVDAIGVDISEEDIKKTKEKLRAKGFSPKLASVADAQKLPFKQNTFDIVLLSDILEHVSQPKAVAREAYRVLKTGGYIYATVPNESHPIVKFDWLRKLLSGRDNVEEHQDVPYNFSKLTILFSKAKIIKSGYSAFKVQIFCQFQK